jgi:hypothetical protein
MSDTLGLVARLRAHEAGRAIRAASHLQVAIQPHALVLTPLAMAGEDTTLHALRLALSTARRKFGLFQIRVFGMSNTI